MDHSPDNAAYQQALDYLYSFINFEQKPADRYHTSKMDTARPRELLALLDNPHAAYPTIHIAGTKGKGSVAAICAAALRASGLRVGLYTSPHLREFRERIRVLAPDDRDGRIPEQTFADLINELRPHIAQLPGITWFEIVTAVAFLHFARQNVDAAVIEVGLGGRLDATNVLTPLVSVITSLSLDHTQLLGDTLAEIAYEKAGIIKPGVPVVSAPQQPEALATLEAVAAERGVPFTLVGRDWRFTGGWRDPLAGRQELQLLHSPDPEFLPAGANGSGPSFVVALSGDHQLENAAVAVAALSIARQQLPQVTVDAVVGGLADVQWHGRLQTIHQSPTAPTLLVDCAHNADSAARLAYALTHDYDYRRLWLIFGAPSDKSIDPMMARLFPLAHQVIVSSADHPRAATPQELYRRAHALGFASIAAPTPADALRTAYQAAAPGDLVCATGSIIFIGDLLNAWDTLKSELTPLA